MSVLSINDDIVSHAASSRSAYQATKRALDLVMALPLLVLWLPVIALAGLLVKLTSRGPALYTQARVGRHGRTYTIYKLRTMTHGCERHSGPRWAVPGDPRVTPLGRFLRRLHLDELPQLWNVLRGDMSLVGPRPERPEFVAQLDEALPGYSLRLAVRPGMTGLAQVQLPADTDLASVQRKLFHDLYYVDHVGLWLDMRILMGTVLYVVGVPFGPLGRIFHLTLTGPVGSVQARSHPVYAHTDDKDDLPAMEFMRAGAG